MATRYERTVLSVDIATDPDYRDGVHEKVNEEHEWAWADQQPIKWNVNDDLHGIGAGLVRIPMTVDLNGHGPARLLFIEIEASAVAFSGGVNLRTDESNAVTGFWLRSVSATENGILFARGLAIALTSGAGSQSLVLQNPSATDITVRVVYAGPDA